MFSRIGDAAYKKDLTNIRLLCETLHHPEQQFPAIHIAGTNGKGSVSHMLAAIFQQAGYKTGLYTSPHLIDFRERIRINGQMITPDEVLHFVQQTQELCETIQPSFFELTVAMAFDAFARHQVDIAIIETGLGGRLDSTNILLPLLSIITNISFDHMHLLGNTLDAIAGEKAGIIKPNIPVVIGEYHPETFPVFCKKAQACNSPLYLAEECWTVKDAPQGQPWWCISQKDHRQWSLLPDLSAQYQRKNIATVLTSIDVFQQHYSTRFSRIRPQHICQALSQVKSLTGLRGRWDVIQQQPMVVLDVAHNESGIAELMQQISAQSFRQLHLVIGFVKDKDIDAALRQMPISAQYYFTQAHLPRALDAHVLQDLASKYALQGKVFSSVQEACMHALAAAHPNDMIVVCGSIFVVAEALQALEKNH
ncbi:MAG: bifunctional folylpolyglutamate synthase/dihydrofolate synthase [Thermoflavifilum sp.]|nr:bifunctional folylpolyglutamate synthase/dihydrofolate synthase [Thermoflavifilum sp.]